MLCAIIGVAAISHALVRLREWLPQTWNKAKRKLPFYARLTALRRGIVYYTIPDYGYVRFPQTGSLIIVAAFCISVIVWTFSILPYYRLTREWGSPPLAVRAGMIGAGLVPFFVSTAVKVNPISVLTGLSHDKLQVFHQWLARLFLFLSIVHTIPFIYQPNHEGGASNLHAYFMSDPIYWNGSAALILLIWIVCSGTRIFRSISYEFFVVQHIATSIGLLICLILHFEDILFSHLWVWAGIAIWAFSTTARTFMAVFSSEFVFAKRTEVEIQSLACSNGVSLNANEKRDTELLKITMPTPMRWNPGQHVYLRFPLVSPLENHPFTMVSLPHPVENCPSQMTLFIRVFNGITRRLHKRAHASSTGSCGCDEKQIVGEKVREESTPSSELSGNHVPFSSQSMRILAIVDGPYGRTNDPAIYESATFVAGGSGAGFVLPMINYLIRRVRLGVPVVTKRVHFIWAARSSNVMNWMMEYLGEVLDSRDTGLDITVSLYSSSPEATVEFERSEVKDMVALGCRPDLPTVLSNEFAQARSCEYTSMGVYTCGPRSLTHTVSNCVSAVQWDILKGSSGSLQEVKLEVEDGEM